MENLASKWRPSEFSDVSSQHSIIKILERQLETKTFKNCYLFCGPSGCGKTTIARIMANKINKGLGTPIEIDGASNNGVENVRNITDSAIERAIDSEYKVYILDEVHSLSNQAWQAFLKTIEEPPKYTIFMFCTTDPQKIPQTIINRCQVFNLNKVSNSDIVKRLKFIASNENINLTDDAADFLMKLANGSMRQAITYLDKCKDYDNNVTYEAVREVLGDCSYELMFDLTNSKIDGNSGKVISIIDDLYNKGTDLKLFIDKYFDFVLDITKYCLFKSTDVISIPSYYSKDLDYVINIDDNVKYFKFLLDKVLSIKQSIKGDNNIKTTIEVMMI